MGADFGGGSSAPKSSFKLRGAGRCSCPQNAAMVRRGKVALQPLAATGLHLDRKPVQRVLSRFRSALRSLGGRWVGYVILSWPEADRPTSHRLLVARSPLPGILGALLITIAALSPGIWRESNHSGADDDALLPRRPLSGRKESCKPERRAGMSRWKKQRSILFF